MLRQRREMDHPAEVERVAWGVGGRTQDKRANWATMRVPPLTRLVRSPRFKILSQSNIGKIRNMLKYLFI